MLVERIAPGSRHWSCGVLLRTVFWICLSPAGDVAARVAVEIGVSLGQADGFDGITERQRVV